MNPGRSDFAVGDGKQTGPSWSPFARRLRGSAADALRTFQLHVTVAVNVCFGDPESSTVTVVVPLPVVAPEIATAPGPFSTCGVAVTPLTAGTMLYGGVPPETTKLNVLPLHASLVTAAGATTSAA